MIHSDSVAFPRVQSARRSGAVRLLLLSFALPLSAPAHLCAAPSAGPTQGAAQNVTTGSKTAPGQPLTPTQLQDLLPEKVYFQGQSAPVQLRNAGGTRFAGGAVVWMALVDTSGYSTSVQQKYQFYLVTETDIRFGGQTLHPGAYGAGFVANDRFVVMDIGGHTVAEGTTSTDSAFTRPRPLLLQAEHADAVRLYLGRRFVAIQATKP